MVILHYLRTYIYMSSQSKTKFPFFWFILMIEKLFYKKISWKQYGWILRQDLLSLKILEVHVYFKTSMIPYSTLHRMPSITACGAPCIADLSGCVQSCKKKKKTQKFYNNKVAAVFNGLKKKLLLNSVQIFIVPIPVFLLFLKSEK